MSPVPDLTNTLRLITGAVIHVEEAAGRLGNNRFWVGVWIQKAAMLAPLSERQKFQIQEASRNLKPHFMWGTCVNR